MHCKRGATSLYGMRRTGTGAGGVVTPTSLSTQSRNGTGGGVISIITATLNAEACLPALIESLRKQTCTDFEWVVVDGASSDSTIELLSRTTDLNLVISSQPDFGIYDALNRGVKLASREYYLVVGADDHLAPDAVERFTATALATDADLVVFNVIAGRRVIDFSRRRRFGHRQRGFAAHSVGTLIRKRLHVTHGYYSWKYPIAADRHFLERVRRGGAKVHFEPRVAGSFGTVGVSSTDRLGSLVEAFRVAVETGGNKAVELLVFMVRFMWNYRKL